MSEAGDVVFSASLRGPGIDPAQPGVVFVASESTPPTPLVWGGQTLEVRTGDLRTVQVIDVASRPDVGLTAFGAGRVALNVGFTDGSSGIFWAEVLETIDVRIDVRPRSPAQRANPRSAGWVRVAILGSEQLRASDIDRDTLAFGPAGVAAWYASARDVDGDGFTDLVAAFRMSETGIAAGHDQACLTGATIDGVPLRGCDVIETVSARSSAPGHTPRSPSIPHRGRAPAHGPKR
jgi:hypothetical protein